MYIRHCVTRNVLKRWDEDLGRSGRSVAFFGIWTMCRSRTQSYLFLSSGWSKSWYTFVYFDCIDFNNYAFSFFTRSLLCGEGDNSFRSKSERFLRWRHKADTEIGCECRRIRLWFRYHRTQRSPPHLNQQTNCLQGTVNLASADPPLKALGGNDGAGQMSHFAQQDGLNLFRLRKTSYLPI